MTANREHSHRKYPFEYIPVYIHVHIKKKKKQEKTNILKLHKIQVTSRIISTRR